MTTSTAFAALIAALLVLSPVQGLDYFTGQSSRRKLQQGPGGGTCQNGPRSAQYRCMSLTSRSGGYQFCARLCQSGLGGRNSDNADNSSPAPRSDLVGSAANGGNNSRLETAGGLGGASLGTSGGAGISGGGGGCLPCIDVQQQCQQGESGAGGTTNAYYKAYINRYYSGVGCQDVGPAVAIGSGTTNAASSVSSPSSSGSTTYSPSSSYSPSPGSYSPSPYSSGGR